MAFASFFRGSRGGDDDSTATPSVPGRSLADRAREVHQNVDISYPRIGPFATVMAKRILDGVRAVLEQVGDERRLDLRATVTLERMLEDYLPTTLRTYARARHEPEARAQVERQLEQLACAVEDTLVAVRENNLQDLQVQGDFLDTKFSGSDLQL
jgi:hypothetical protein